MELNTSLQPLAAELAADPLQRGYSGMAAAELVADLNNPQHVEPFERLITLRSLAGVLGSDLAIVVVAEIEKIGTPASLWHAEELRKTEGGGLNISSPEVEDLVSYLVGKSVVTQQQAEKVLDLGRRRVSRAQQLGYSKGVTIDQINRIKGV